MNEFNTIANKGFLWKLMFENGVFQDINENYVKNIKTLFDEKIAERSRWVTSTDHLIDINKQVITSMVQDISKYKMDSSLSSMEINKINNPTALISAAEISAQKQTVFQKGLELKKTEFNQLNQRPVPPEIDFSDAFGYEETKDLDGPETFETFMDELDLSPDEAAERTLSQGKEFDKKRHNKKLKRVPKKIKKKPGYIDTLTLMERKKIEEERKEKMRKMVEDMVLGKKSNDKEVSKKSSAMSKLLTKNLESIKKIADKEGISVSELIKILKKGE